MISLLLCYHPSWLQLGLEVLFGEDLSNDITQLSKFITNRVLYDEKIAAKHRTPTNLFTESHREALNAFALKKILSLVYILDQLRNAYILENQLSLFNKVQSITFQFIHFS